MAMLALASALVSPMLALPLVGLAVYGITVLIAYAT
jgi:hypothetical protein